MKKLLSFCLVSLGLALLAIPSSWATTYGDGNTDIRIGYEDKNCISNTEWTLLYNNCSLSKVTGIKGDSGRITTTGNFRGALSAKALLIRRRTRRVSITGNTMTRRTRPSASSRGKLAHTAFLSW